MLYIYWPRLCLAALVLGVGIGFPLGVAVARRLKWFEEWAVRKLSPTGAHLGTERLAVKLPAGDLEVEPYKGDPLYPGVNIYVNGSYIAIVEQYRGVVGEPPGPVRVVVFDDTRKDDPSHVLPVHCGTAPCSGLSTP